MNTNDDNDLKIADYLNDNMTATEEVAFMHELSENKELRHKFEEELLLRSLFAKKDAKQNEDPLLLQPADEHINIIETALEKEREGKVIPMFTTYRIVAAIIFFIISAFVVFLIVRSRAAFPVDTVKNKAHQQKDSLLANRKNQNKQSLDTMPNIAITTNINTDRLYAGLYHSYTPDDDDPVELYDCYKHYKQGSYNQVLAVNEADIQLMGADNRNELLKQYLHLYKGLSYLAKGEPTSTLTELAFVLHTADQQESLYQTAQWYSALAWLKKGEVSKASSAATEIVHSNSPYKNKAAQLLQAIGSTAQPN